jgi:NADH dehydrogenase
VENVEARGVTLGKPPGASAQSDGRFLPAGTVIWGAGVAASPAGKWLGVETDRAGRIRAGRDLTVPGLPGIYALGDTALVEGDDGKPLPGLAQVAKQQGQWLGEALRIRLVDGANPGKFVFHNRGNLATIGRNSAVADFGRIRLKGFLAWLLWCLVHVYLLIGFRNRLLVSLEWLWDYLTFQRGARLITEDRDTPCAPAETQGPAEARARIG